MKYLVIAILSFVFLAALGNSVDAASSKIYGGGGKTAALKPTATPVQARPMPKQQTKSALPLYNTPKNVKTTPSTGPELLPEALLVSSFALGIFIKRRA